MLLPILAINASAIALMFLLLWGISLMLRDVSIIDIFWGLGFVLVGWISLLLSEFSAKGLFIALLVSLWGIRLSAYLALRNWGKPEDYRYQAMRDKHGNKFPVVSLFTVFGLQASLIWIISLPLQVGILRAGMWEIFNTIGFCLWFTGLIFETVGDFQLLRFKSNPDNNGKVMNKGLWKFTRHPNYFGEFLVWWGFYLVVEEPQSWWWTILAPILMSFLLIRVSGVRLLESSLRSRVAGYEEYVRKTSAFFPLPPRNSSQQS